MLTNHQSPITNHQITIIGGGITGLAAAYIAAKAGQKVRVIEGSEKFGGLLNTFPIGGNRLEFFTIIFLRMTLNCFGCWMNWVYPTKLFGIKLKWVFSEMVKFTRLTPLDLLNFEPISLIGKLRFGLTSLYLSKWGNWRKNEGISSLEWFNKWAGKSVTEAIWKPLLNIKFGLYAKEIPLSWMIGRMRQRVNSRKKGSEQLGYLKVVYKYFWTP